MAKVNKSEKLLSEPHRHEHEVEVRDGEKRDPLKIQNIQLAEDFYALTWTALRDQCWKDKSVRGVEITLNGSDYFWLHMNFVMFVVILLLTVVLLLYEVFTNDVYADAGVPIMILRITLVGFAQKNLSPEFYQGLSELRFTMRNPAVFSHPGFAAFIAICQISVAAFVVFGIILFVCMADEALDLVIDFAGLSVLAELDDWLGEVIMAEKVKVESEDNEEFDLEGLNSRMTIWDKLALVDEEDLKIVDDQNFIDNAPWHLRCFSWLVFSLPWQFILPLLTLPINWILQSLQRRAYIGGASQ
jgi:hypothetical protein